MIKNGVLLLHDNGRHHSAAATVEGKQVAEI